MKLKPNLSLLDTGQWLKGLKEKIVNFDIKPGKPIIAGLLQEADSAYAAKDYIRTEKILRKLLTSYNTDLGILIRLIEFYIEFERISDAARLTKYAIKHHPDESALHNILGLLYIKLGNLRASSKAYKNALRLCPDSASLKHFLDATLRNNTSLPPRSYIVTLFDGYADHFEYDLLHNLSYQTPTKLAEYLRDAMILDQPLDTVLDLGCGTGLLGQELIKCFNIKQLIGVDLSPKMLDQCRAKNIYHDLHNVDLIDYLRSTENSADLIASSDVFIYVGDLSPVLENCYRVLKPGGYLCFTVEKLWWGNYKLTTTGRYQHSLRYIKSLYKRYHFSKIYSQTIDLRKESGNMVVGYLVLLQK